MAHLLLWVPSQILFLCWGASGERVRCREPTGRVFPCPTHQETCKLSRGKLTHRSNLTENKFSEAC